MLVTNEGIKFDFENIDEKNIRISDIIHSLSMINRFVGHSSRPYSVGEHSILCNRIASFLGYTNREKILVLTHDFAEAYVGDVSSPLKALLPEFSNIESKVEDAIYKYINIEPPTSDEVDKIKCVDYTALVIEMRDLTKHNYKEFNNPLVDWDIVDKLPKIPQDEMHFTNIQNELSSIFYDVWADTLLDALVSNTNK